MYLIAFNPNPDVCGCCCGTKIFGRAYLGKVTADDFASLELSLEHSPPALEKTLCELCKGIDLDSLTSESGYVHASDPDVLGQSAESCPLCAALNEQLSCDYWDCLYLRLVSSLDSPFKRLKGFPSHQHKVLDDLECLELVQIVAEKGILHSLFHHSSALNFRK